MTGQRDWVVFQPGNAASQECFGQKVLRLWYHASTGQSSFACLDFPLL